MSNAIDYHFKLHEKIEKYRPKRNGDGNIEKCIAVCEKGMDNLPAFVKKCHVAYKGHSIIVPPSVPCRDILLKCYLIISDFEKARSVVNRSIECKSWNEVRGNEELEFIDKVQNAYTSVQSRVKEYPGTLQKDLYAIFPELDRDALKWFMANTDSLIKRKNKNTYSLWLEGQDIPDEFKTEIQVTESNYQNYDSDLALRDINLSLFPKWYVSISFGFSTSKNYQKAVNLAKMAPQYIESYDSDQNIIHQAVYSEKHDDYLSFISLYEMINNWKSCFVIINGKIVDRKIVGGLNYCYGDKIRSGNPDFCYGASEMTENPFGCHRLQISSSNNPWWSFGSYDEYGVWQIDKHLILRRIEECSKPYHLCPAFSLERIMEAFDNLPDTINPKKDRNWVVEHHGVIPRVNYERNFIQVTGEKNDISTKKEGLLSSVLKLIGIKKN